MDMNHSGVTNNGVQQEDSLYADTDNSNQGNNYSDNSNQGNDNSATNVGIGISDSLNDNSDNSNQGNGSGNVGISDSGNDNSDNSNQGNGSGNLGISDSGNDNSDNSADDSRTWQNNSAYAMGENITDSFNDNSDNSVRDSGNDNSDNSVRDSGNDNSDNSNQGNNSGNDNSDNSNQGNNSGNDNSTTTDLDVALDVAIADSFNTDNSNSSVNDSGNDNSDSSNQGNNSGNDNSDNSNQGNNSGNDNSDNSMTDSGNDNSTSLGLDLDVALHDAFNDKSIDSSFNDLSTSFGKIDVNFENVFNGAFGDGSNNTAFAVSQVADIVDHDTLSGFSQNNQGTFSAHAAAAEAGVSGSWAEIGADNGGNGVADIAAIADGRASASGTAFNMEVVMGANLQQNAFDATVIGGHQDNDTSSGDSF